MTRKSLRDYTDDELYQVLENNMTSDLQELAGICSEVLRRMLAKDLKPKKSTQEIWEAYQASLNSPSQIP